MSRALCSNDIQAFIRRASLTSKTLGIAVSGGADSMALCYLLKQTVGSKRLLAFTVDHGLRPESHKEAQAVNSILGEMGIRHLILPIDWSSIPNPTKISTSSETVLPIPPRQIELKAREQRYRVLARACEQNGISQLFVGHHLNDQIETMIYRIGRYSGNDGIAAMKEVSQRYPVDAVLHPGIALLRPLLEYTKSRILQTCKENKIPWIEDPMNNIRDIARNRIRHALSELEKKVAQGQAPSVLSVEGFKRFSDHFRDHREYAEQQVKEILSHQLLKDPATGMVFLRIDESQRNPTYWFNNPAIAHRVLIDVVRSVGVVSLNKGPPSLTQLKTTYEAMLQHLRKEKPFRSIVLNGALIKSPRLSQTGADYWAFTRQPMLGSDLAKARQVAKLGESVLYDFRFQITLCPGQEKASSQSLLSNPIVSERVGLGLDMNSSYIIRELTHPDIESLKRQLSQSKARPHYMFLRTLKHYMSKMPTTAWFTIPVIATLPELHPDKISLVVSIPSLGIHLIPHLVFPKLKNIRMKP